MYPPGYKHGQVVNIVDERLMAEAGVEEGGATSSSGANGPGIQVRNKLCVYIRTVRMYMYCI